MLGTWGVAAFAAVPALQHIVVSLAKRLKLEATDVVSGLNIGAFNMEIAGGSFIGSVVESQGGLATTSLVAAGVTFLGILLIWLTSARLKGIP